jgi:steroid delta-isomerase
MSLLNDQHMAAALQSYVDNISDSNLDAVINLFAEDAIVEDPVGTDPHIGHAALREFYQVACDSVSKMILEGNVRTAKKWASAGILAYPKGAEDSLVIEIIDVMEFNEEGKITKMTAYWGDSNMRAIG